MSASIAVGAQARVAAAEAREVVDARDLEPDEVDGVVRDALRVGLGEAHAHLGREVEVHGAADSTIDPCRQALAELIRAPAAVRRPDRRGRPTESGIPDFRSPTGLWAQFDPLEYGSIEAFRADPLKVWSFYKPRVAMLTEAEPNAGAPRARRARAAAASCEAVVTQNIDLLHERAGSREVVEVHGSIRTATCPGLRRAVPARARARAAGRRPMRRRARPAARSLKPDVVFFGELLPVEAIDRAYELARGAALLLVVGSSLEVYPVAGAAARRRSPPAAQLAIVNRGPTPYDGEARR